MTRWLSARHWSLRTLAAVTFGVLTALAFAPYSWWPLGIVGAAGLTLVIAASRNWWGAAGLGYAFGLGLLFLGVGWMQIIFLQAMIALVMIEAAFFCLLGVVIRLALLTPWWPPVVAAAWVIVEFCYSHFPFGGFGWMRLGYAMVDAPFGWGLPLYGVAGSTLLAAFAAQLVAWFAMRPRRRSALIGGVALIGILGVAAAGLGIPAGSVTGSVNAGWVQGGAPGGGVYGLGPLRSITRNQTAETERLMARVDGGQLPHPDFVVWPENSTDLDPASDPQTGQLVAEAAARADVPLFLGVILDGPGADERQTASLWRQPDGTVSDRYIKRGIVPFGEWVPFREVLLPLIPELAYVGPQSVPGTAPGVIHPQLADGRRISLGVIVCYDLAFDQIVSDTVTNGAQAIVVQSSNAMYQGTGQIDQQFAITRARAMELRREILVVTTSGVSGLIRPDGSVAFQVSDPGSASGVVSLPLQSGATPAAAYGSLLELVVVTLGLLALAGSFWYGRMSTSTTQQGVEDD